MKHIGNLTYARGSRKNRKRIGRGQGSGRGGTSTRGHKGHKSRGGFRQIRSFEGGQMPLNRRIPKFGFKNPFRVEYQIVNVGRLQELAEQGRLENNEVSAASLYAIGAVANKNMPVKILGDGDLKTSLNVTARKFSQSAKAKIESAGGTVTIDE